MKGIKLELWIVSLTTWNFIIVQRSHGRLIVNKHYAVFTNLYQVDTLHKADTWEGPEGVRLIEVSLYLRTNNNKVSIHVVEVCFLNNCTSQSGSTGVFTCSASAASLTCNTKIQ